MLSLIQVITYRTFQYKLFFSICVSFWLYPMRLQLHRTDCQIGIRYVQIIESKNSNSVWCNNNTNKSAQPTSHWIHVKEAKTVPILILIVTVSWRWSPTSFSGCRNQFRDLQAIKLFVQPHQLFECVIYILCPMEVHHNESFSQSYSLVFEKTSIFFSCRFLWSLLIDCLIKLTCNSWTLIVYLSYKSLFHFFLFFLNFTFLAK